MARPGREFKPMVYGESAGILNNRGTKTQSPPDFYPQIAQRNTVD